MRLDQFISKSLDTSRRNARQIIKSGAVKKDGQKELSPAIKISKDTIITHQDTALPWPEHQYWLLNKPAGYCCSHIDDAHPSIFHLLPKHRAKMHIAGRLDADTTGLVLLSSDGNWCHRVTSPRQRLLKSKHYYLTLSNPLKDCDKSLLTQGIKLRGDERATLSCRIEPIDSGYTMTLHEGRYHQIKRMFGSMGYRVTQLHRYQIAHIGLGELKEGDFRELTKPEINGFSQ